VRRKGNDFVSRESSDSGFIINNTIDNVGLSVPLP
jgi:hypothetical protein